MTTSTADIAILRKAIDTGVSINGALFGTRRLYNFAHPTPTMAVLSKLEKLVTINSAIEVDFTGQVNAEQSGGTYLGGRGGQVDFVRAGARSAGGHSIVAMPATAKGGTISRLTAHFSGPVTTTRSDVDLIVTEFGAAELKGQALTERTRRLNAIAHSDFQEQLARDAHNIQQRGF